MLATASLSNTPLCHWAWPACHTAWGEGRNKLSTAPLAVVSNQISTTVATPTRPSTQGWAPKRRRERRRFKESASLGGIHELGIEQVAEIRLGFGQPRFHQE